LGRHTHSAKKSCEHFLLNEGEIYGSREIFYGAG